MTKSDGTNPKVAEVPFWVNGKHTRATSGRSGEVTNPATGAVARRVDFANAVDIDAAVKERRTARRTGWAAELVIPAVVAVMAALVAFQALTVFQPLIEIIDHLC